MAILSYTPQQFAEMVSREIDKTLVDAIEKALKPRAEAIVRQVARDIAGAVKSKVVSFPPDYSKPALEMGARIFLQFNTEEIREI